MSDTENGILPEDSINSSVCVAFIVKTDAEIEGDEVFTISLSVDNGNVRVFTDEINITIEDSLGNIH